jgi:hypothetical protein
MEITDVNIDIHIIDQKVKDILKRYEEGILEDKNQRSLSYINWKVESVLEEHKTLEISSQTLEYNVIKFKFQKRSPGIEDLSNHEGFIIIYFIDNNLYYISSRNSDAKTIIRKLLGYTGKEEIIEYNHEIKNDLIFWMIHKVYTQNNILDINGDNKKLSIDGIKAFKGNSQDLLTTVTADGESVMNIISTMSFLLESGKIDSIVIEVSYKEHDSIEMVLGTNNYPSINIDSYIGKYNKFEFRDQREWLLYILLFIELLTNITQAYMDELDSETWDENKYKEFLKSVADDLMSEVKLKIKDLEAGENTCDGII